MSEVWSESVYLDAVSPDGTLAFVARLGRYPTKQIAWVWAHVFTPNGCVSYNHDQVLCDGHVVAVDDPDAAYDAGDGSASFRREGPRGGIQSGAATVRVLAHAGSTAPNRPGTVPLELDATFRPHGVLPGAGNLPGRTEEHGTVRVRASWPGGELDLEALGQWHEQHQEAPRFTVPFTYITVRGVDTSLVAIIGAKNSGGILRRAGTGIRATAVRITPPGDARTIECDLEDGSTITGAVRSTYRYSVPIDGRPRPGTIVTGTRGGADVSGCVNDWIAPPA
jgi:hypothetical protein